MKCESEYPCLHLRYSCHTPNWRVSQDPAKTSTREEPFLPHLLVTLCLGSVHPIVCELLTRHRVALFFPILSFSSFAAIPPPSLNPTSKAAPPTAELVFCSPNQCIPSRGMLSSTLPPALLVLPVIRSSLNAELCPLSHL